jgi:hypothetical protein
MLEAGSFTGNQNHDRRCDDAHGTHFVSPRANQAELAYTF